MAQEVVGPNRPLRDIRNVISKEYNAWTEDYVPTSEGLRSGKIYVEEAKPKLQEQRERLTILYTKFDDLRQQSGKANPFDPTLIKDLESTLDAIYNNSKSIDYDLKLIRNFEKSQEPKQAAATQTAGDSVAASQASGASTGAAGANTSSTVSTEESARIKNNSGGGEPVIGTSGGAGGTGNNKYSLADLAKNQDPYKLVESQSVDATATQTSRWGINQDAQYIAGADTDIQEWDNTITVTGKNKPISRRVTPNPLHAYVNYTYGMSLHMLSKSDFNKMAENPDSDWLPTTTIVASAGKYGQPGFDRADAFQDDFYFEDLKFETIIGNTPGNSGTNALIVDFTLIEPYGLTLIDRLQDACLAIDGKSYLDLPYLLQIDFYGYDDEGGEATELKDQRKYIPILLRGCKIKAGTKGSEYQITSVVFSHGGFFESVLATPANLDVTAGTLEQYFKDDSTDQLVNTLNERAESEEKQKNLTDEQKSEAASVRTSSDGNKNKGKSTAQQKDEVNGYTVNSYVMAYNAWQQLTVKRGNATAANKIMVEFDKAIIEKGGGVLVDEKTQSVKRAGHKNVNNKTQRADLEKHNTGDAVVAYDAKIAKTSVRSGTSIIEVINQAMMRSAYIRKQMKDPTKEIEQLAPEDIPVNWYKIIPTVKPTKFCPQTSTWKMDITYSVVQYTIHNQTHPNAPISIPKEWVKDYQYIYTGQNNDIIDFSIDYESGFFTLVQVDKGKNQATEGVQATPDQETKLDQDPAKTVQGDPTADTKSPTQSRKKLLTSDNLKSTVTDTRGSSQQVAASSFADHINKTSAEGLQVKLKIVGDPQWIKQDEVFYSPRARKYIDLGSEYNAPYVSDEKGSLGLDGGEIHVQLAWETPVDIDEETGGMRNEGRYQKSAFSGIYKVVRVESNFSRGQFTQTLEMYRLAGQPSDYLDAGNSSAIDNRKDQNIESSSFKYYQAEDENTEQYKTRVMTHLLENKYNSNNTDVNTNNDKVDTSPETSNNSSEWSKPDQLKNVVSDAPTETIA